MLTQSRTENRSPTGRPEIDKTQVKMSMHWYKHPRRRVVLRYCGYTQPMPDKQAGR